MPRLFYSTGQVARQLGTTPAAIRVLCENRLIAAETSPGGHWRVPASEVERLKRDGLPAIPRPLPNPSAPARNGTSNGHGYAEFVRNRPTKLRWLPIGWRSPRARLNNARLNARSKKTKIGSASVTIEKLRRRLRSAERAEAEEAEQRHQEWVLDWTQYALNSLPWGARQEVEVEVYMAVQEALSLLQSGEPQGVTQRLVDAAVHRALAPWTRQQEIERALTAGMDKLGWTSNSFRVRAVKAARLGRRGFCGP